MNEKICFLIVIIAYAIYHRQREIFFNIIYTLSFIELSYKCLSHNIIKDLFTFRKTVMYYFSARILAWFARRIKQNNGQDWREKIKKITFACPS